MEKSLIILRGLPGGGKSTFAELISEGKYPICCADDFFVSKDGTYNWSGDKLHLAHKYSESQCEYFMGESVEKIIVANTSVRYRDMSVYFKLAEKYGYKVYSLIVENRHNGVNTHNVPKETIDSMRERFNIKL